MRLLSIISVCFLFTTALLGQECERKIIIENNIFHAVSIDQRYQIGTYHTGQVSDTLKTGMNYALPAGRSLGGNMMPLVWDMNSDLIFAISFLDHPLNDRMEAIKKIKKDSLQTWDKYRHPGEVILESVDNNIWTKNAPYSFMLKRNNQLDHLYFDAIFKNNTYWYVITNGNEWYQWKYSENEWTRSEMKINEESGLFALNAIGNRIILTMQNGSVYEINGDKPKLIAAPKNGFDLSKMILIENRDKNELSYVELTQVGLMKPLNEIINEFAKNLIE